MAQNNMWGYLVGNILGGLPATMATGGAASGIASALGVKSITALNAIAGAVPAAIRGGANAAASGGDIGQIIVGAVTEGAFGAVSFGFAGTAAQSAVSKLLTGAPALLQRTLPVLAGAGTTALANTGLNLGADLLMGRDIDWKQAFANMGMDFLFSLFLSGKSGDIYLNPQTGRAIEVPEGKTLRSVNAEADAFYKALGDTKVTGGLDNAVGDIYMNYMDIPESVVSNAEFTPMERAYRIYEANPTIENGAAFLKEASEIYDMPGVTQYTFDPMVTMDAAANARFRGTLDEIKAARKAGIHCRNICRAKVLRVPLRMWKRQARLVWE